jgi:YbbR domain-containing protein
MADEAQGEARLQRFLSNLGTVGLSLFLAMIIWIVAVRQENPLVIDTFGPIPIEVVNLPGNMVIFGDVPKSLQVTLRATEASWRDLADGKFRAWVDLEGLNTGLHDVPLSIECSDRSIQILEKEPDSINIRLELVAEKEFEVRARVADSPPLGYIDRAPTVAPGEAVLRGPAPLVEQVNEVVAEVFLRGAKSSVKRVVELSARNEEGDAISGVTITPQRVTVEVPVDQRFGYKDVSVRASVSGRVAPGHWISNITVEPSTVTLVGSPSVLAELPGYVETLPVDVQETTADVTERVALDLPTGSSVVLAGSDASTEPNSVLVTVNVAAIEGGKTVRRALAVQGLAANLVAVPSPSGVDVIVSGPLPRLQTLKSDEVRVILDLYGLEPGTHKIVPSVVVPEGLKVTSLLPDTVEVEIRVEPTPTPVGPTMTPTITPTLSLD